MEQNTARMQLQWNPPRAIEALFQQFENGVSFATASQDAPTKPTVLSWAYSIIEKRDDLTLPVVSGARWILTQKTGQFSRDISRLQTRIYGASTRRVLLGSIVQRILYKQQAPC
jgi:hypothetical protein